MKLLDLISKLRKQPQTVSETSSYLFDDQLTEATMRSQNPSASELAMLEECFGPKKKNVPSHSAAKHPRRRKIA
jgi:hypothetical protein